MEGEDTNEKDGKDATAPHTPLKMMQTEGGGRKKGRVAEEGVREGGNEVKLKKED